MNIIQCSMCGRSRINNGLDCHYCALVKGCAAKVSEITKERDNLKKQVKKLEKQLQGLK